MLKENQLGGFFSRWNYGAIADPIPLPLREGQGEGAQPQAPKMTSERVRDLRINATVAERTLWRHLRTKQVHGLRFRRQFPIGPFIVDFVCLKARLVIEVDGGQHAIDVAYDDARTRWLESQGFAVIRFWNNDALQSTEGVVDEVATHVKARVAPSPHAHDIGRRPRK